MGAINLHMLPRLVLHGELRLVDCTPVPISIRARQLIRSFSRGPGEQHCGGGIVICSRWFINPYYLLSGLGIDGLIASVVNRLRTPTVLICRTRCCLYAALFTLVLLQSCSFCAWYRGPH